MPPCISANSFCPSSREIHFNFTPLRPLLYSVLSTNWYILERRATLSASSSSSGSSPCWRKWTVCCAHAGACGSTTRTEGTSLLRERPLLRRGYGAQPELDVPRQACRSKTCRERLLLRNKPWGFPEQTDPQRSWRRSWGPSWRRLRGALPEDSRRIPTYSYCSVWLMALRMAESA